MKRHAELCPVCKGSGKYRSSMDCNHTSITYTECTCHGCGGTGWITITDDTTPEYPYPNPFNNTYYQDSGTDSCDYYIQHKYEFPDGNNHYMSCDCHIPHID